MSEQLEDCHQNSDEGLVDDTDDQSVDDNGLNDDQTSNKRPKDDMTEENVNQTDDNKSAKKVKKVIKDSEILKSNKRGIVYLSFVPFGLNVNKIRQLLSEFGEVERIYLEKEKSPNEEMPKKRKKMKKSYNFHYAEGWVEFKKKSVAKMVAQMLNGKQIGGKRKTRFYDQLWSIKYLHRFKWSHLAEQLSYEKALRQQRLRLEIGRAKQETAFYEQMSHKFKHNKRNKVEEQARDKRVYKQRQTDEAIRQKKTDPDVDFELLSKIFK